MLLLHDAHLLLLLLPQLLHLLLLLLLLLLYLLLHLLLHSLLHGSHELSEVLPLRPPGFFLRPQSGHDVPDMLRRHRIAASRHGATRGPMREAAWRWRHVCGPVRHRDSGMAVVCLDDATRHVAQAA